MLSYKFLFSIQRKRIVIALMMLLTSSFVESGSKAYGEILIADRLSNSVYRYSDSGILLNTVLTDNTNLNQPSGITVSADFSRIFLSSFQNGRVIRYDYNASTGFASNSTVIIDGTNGTPTSGDDFLVSPSRSILSPDQSSLYVASLGGTGIGKYTTDGVPVGSPLQPSTGPGSLAGLAYTNVGELLVSNFGNGAIYKLDATINSLSEFAPADGSRTGATALLLHDKYIYVSSLFAGNVQRLDVTTGMVDNTFAITGLEFPQDLLLSPDGSGFMVGILGVSNGAGRIDRYSFDGTFLNTFATAGTGGFTEATAFARVVAVPEPKNLVFLTLMLATTASISFHSRRRFTEATSPQQYSITPTC